MRYKIHRLSVQKPVVVYKKKDEMQFFFNLFNKKCCCFAFNYYIASLN